MTDEQAAKLEIAKCKAYLMTNTENFDTKWLEYVSFLKKTEPNLEQLTPESIATDFKMFWAKDQEPPN